MARRLALVTGGSRGIGRAIALALGKNGCDVVVNYNASVEAAEALCGELDVFQHDNFSHQLKVTEVSEWIESTSVYAILCIRR